MQIVDNHGAELIYNSGNSHPLNHILGHWPIFEVPISPHKVWVSHTQPRMLMSRKGPRNMYCKSLT